MEDKAVSPPPTEPASQTVKLQIPWGACISALSLAGVLFFGALEWRLSALESRLVRNVGAQAIKAELIWLAETLEQGQRPDRTGTERMKNEFKNASWRKAILPLLEQAVQGQRRKETTALLAEGTLVRNRSLDLLDLPWVEEGYAKLQVFSSSQDLSNLELTGMESPSCAMRKFDLGVKGVDSRICVVRADSAKPRSEIYLIFPKTLGLPL